MIFPAVGHRLDSDGARFYTSELDFVLRVPHVHENILHIILARRVVFLFRSRAWQDVQQTLSFAGKSRGLRADVGTRAATIYGVHAEPLDRLRPW